MDGARFDRLARTFGKRLSRRKAIGGAAALALVSGRVSAATTANQLTPATCGASGDVCTLLMGCCDGFTCVTSAINVNYGVCVTGEGGTIAGGTSLISPFSDNAETEAAAIAAEQSATTTTSTTATTTETDPDVVREQRRAEKQTRRTSRRNEQQTRRSTRQTDLENRRETQRTNRELRRGPKLHLQLFLPDDVGEPEILKVTNRDDSSIVLGIIETIPPLESIKISPEQTLGVGDSFVFLSGALSQGDLGIKGSRYGWLPNYVCTDFDGFTVHAANAFNSVNFEYTILCDESEVGNGNGKPRRKKRKQQGGKGKNKNGNRNGG